MEGLAIEYVVGAGYSIGSGGTPVSRASDLTFRALPARSRFYVCRLACTCCVSLECSVAIFL